MKCPDKAGVISEVSFKRGSTVYTTGHTYHNNTHTPHTVHSKVTHFFIVSKMMQSHMTCSEHDILTTRYSSQVSCTSPDPHKLSHVSISEQHCTVCNADNNSFHKSPGHLYFIHVSFNTKYICTRLMIALSKVHT